MNFRNVEAGSGVTWLTAGVELVLKNPGVFIVMALILAVIGVVPVLGSLVLTILGPALLGGMLYGLREQDQGRSADIGQLFRAFQEPGKLGPMLMLCLPSIAAAVLAIVLGFMLLGGVLLGTGAANHAGAGLLLGLGGGIFFVLLMLAVVIVVYALTFFAVPLVMLDGIEPIAAMKTSLAATTANVGAMLIYLAILCAGMIVVFVVIGAASHVLASLLIGLVFYPVVASASYYAWKQVFTGAPAETIVPPPQG